MFIDVLKGMYKLLLYLSRFSSNDANNALKFFNTLSIHNSCVYQGT